MIDLYWITVLVVAAYFIAVLYIGARASRFIKTAEDYVVAGRNLGFLAFMILIVGSVMSGMTVLGASGLAYIAGWPSMWEPIFVCFSVAVLMILFGAKLYRVSRRMSYNTVQDYLAHRFESPKAMRALAATAGVIISFIYLTGQFRAISIVLAWLFGIPHVYALLLSAVVITAYVVLGGLYAVAYTTLVQGIALLAGCILMVPFVLKAAGGMAYVNAQLASIDPNLVAVAYPQVHPPLGGHAFLTPLYLVSFFCLLSLGLATAPHALNNVLAARRSSYFKWAPLVAFLIYITAFYLIKMAGLAARVMAFNGVLQVPHPDYAIVAAIEHSFPAAAWSLFAVIVLAAVMSTTDRLLLTIGTLYGWDIHKNVLHTSASDAQVKSASRWMVLIAAVLSFVAAINPPALLAWLIWMGIGLMLATYCVPLLAGLYWRGATREGGIASMVVGMTGAVVFGYIHQYVTPLPAHFSFFAFIASAAAMVIVSLLTRKTSPEVLDATETGPRF